MRLYQKTWVSTSFTLPIATPAPWKILEYSPNKVETPCIFYMADLTFLIYIKPCMGGYGMTFVFLVIAVGSREFHISRACNARMKASFFHVVYPVQLETTVNCTTGAVECTGNTGDDR